MTSEAIQKAFKDWLLQNGAIFDKVEYPVNVDGVRSSIAKEEIAPGEGFLFIPNKCILSVEHARNSELSDIFKSHDQLFVSNPHRDNLILIVFYLFERTTKGD